MKLSRVDILNTKFTRTLRGYSVPEVDGFLQDLADQVGELSKELAMWKEEAVELRERLSDYEARDATLRDTLISAHKMSEELKDASQREARLTMESAQATAEKVTATAQAKADTLLESARMKAAKTVEEAEAKADRTLSDARMRLAKVQESISETKRLRAHFDMKLRSVLTEHTKMLDLAAEEQKELEEAEYKLRRAQIAASQPQPEQAAEPSKDELARGNLEPQE